MDQTVEGGTDAVLRLRIRILRGFFVALVGILVFRLWYMQILQGAEYVRRSDQRRTVNRAVLAPRGRILDRDGSILASNRHTWTVVIIPEKVRGWKQGHPDFEGVARRLEEIFHGARSASSMVQAIKAMNSWAPYRPVEIIDDVSYETIANLKELGPELAGVDVVSRLRRSYDHPYGANAFHVVGYVQPIGPEELQNRLKQGYEPDDVIGKDGVEAQYESDLAGQKGREVIRAGREIQRIDPRPGADITLTISAQLQAAAEKALADGVSTNHGVAGALVAISPVTGEVYALANYPAFRSEWFRPNPTEEERRDLERRLADRSGSPWYNHAISAKQPPASSMKFVTLTAALEEKAIMPSTTTVCTGKITLGPQTFRCWVPAGHGVVGVVRALTISCNSFFYRAGIAVGRDALLKWIRLFGFGTRTGIDLPAEGRGAVPDLAAMRQRGEEWFAGDTANLAIGQGAIECTPLQMAVATAAVANGGRRVIPHVVQSIVAEGRPKEVPPPAVSPETVPISDETLSLVRQGMRQVIASPEGTAYRVFRDFHRVSVAGKTGSSEVRSSAWFTSYAPADDPKIVVVAYIERGGYGSDSAAPAAREVLAAAFDENGHFLMEP